MLKCKAREGNDRSKAQITRKRHRIKRRKIEPESDKFGRWWQGDPTGGPDEQTGLGFGSDVYFGRVG